MEQLHAADCALRDRDRSEPSCLSSAGVSSSAESARPGSLLGSPARTDVHRDNEH